MCMQCSQKMVLDPPALVSHHMGTEKFRSAAIPASVALQPLTHTWNTSTKKDEAWKLVIGSPNLEK